MNPWIHIPDSPPYILEEDSDHINVYNNIENIGKNKRFLINTNYVPEARLGPINAPVVFLQLNPSYDKSKPKGPDNRDEIETDIKTIKNENTPHKGAFASTEWWGSRLKEIRKDINNDTHLSNNILSIEFFPYRSLSFAHSEIRTPSQSYSFNLVNAAIKRNALIIIGRGWKLWCSAIPLLYRHYDENVFLLKNPQCSYYSKNNLGNETYMKIIEKLKYA